MKHLRAHPLTQRAIETTQKTFEELLEGVRLELGDPLMPRSWLITWPDGLVSPERVSDVQPFAVLVWFYTQDSWNYPDHRMAASDYLLKAEYEISHKTAIEYGRKQSEKAKKPRSVMMDVVQRLAREPEPARDLWPRLIGEMDTKQLEPREVGSGVLRYYAPSGKESSYTFKTFQNQLSEARKRTRSR